MASSGKDSLVVLDLARRVEPDVPVVFFDSAPPLRSQ
ncbi:phosphoadenosine phosphosulfate reductase family protein [Rhodococcus sp. NPDC057014]